MKPRSTGHCVQVSKVVDDALLEVEVPVDFEPV
jgi:hypothetical protein